MLFMVFFAVQKIFNLMYSHLFTFASLVIIFEFRTPQKITSGNIKDYFFLALPLLFVGIALNLQIAFCNVDILTIFSQSISTEYLYICLCLFQFFSLVFYSFQYKSFTFLVKFISRHFILLMQL